MRAFPALVIALVLALAGCGGDGGEAGGAAADVVPADVGLYVSGNTDFESEEWRQAEALVRKFPDGDRAVAMLLEQLQEEEDVDFEEDVRPALGPEVAVVAFDLTESEPVFVGLTQPEDEAKFEELLAKGDEPAVSEEVEGWTVFADEQAHIDRFTEAQTGGSLADSDDFAEAMDGLEDGLVSLYVNGAALESALEEDPQVSQEQLELFLPEGRVPSFGAILRAEDEGVRVDGNGVFAADLEESALATEPYEAQFPDEVPGGVLLYLSFNDFERQISGIRDGIAQVDPEFESQLGRLEGMLGVSLEEDIAPLFAEEGAFYLRRGSPIPEITLLTAVEDEEQALATLDDVVEGVRQLAPFPLAEPQTTEIAGVEARQLGLGAPVSLFYAAFEGKLVLTTAREGIADLVEEDERFADEDAFEQARERSGLPDETVGWGYVNLADAVPLLLDFAALGDESVPPEVRANTEPLQSLVFYSTIDGDRTRFSFFLGVE